MIYYHFRKWSEDGSFEKVLDAIVVLNKSHIDLSEIHLDGSHTPAKKGGEKVSYQGRKKSKTTNLIVLTDKKGVPIRCVSIESGNHNDNYNITTNIRESIKKLQAIGLSLLGATLNADAGFDTIKLRKQLLNYKITPNIKENPRNRKKSKRGRKPLFNPEKYKNRIAVERLFSRLDSFRTLLVRHERKATQWAAFHTIAFALFHLETLN
jgi:transposase